MRRSGPEDGPQDPTQLPFIGRRLSAQAVERPLFEGFRVGFLGTTTEETQGKEAS